MYHVGVEEEVDVSVENLKKCLESTTFSSPEGCPLKPFSAQTPEPASLLARFSLEWRPMKQVFSATLSQFDGGMALAVDERVK